MITRRLVVKHPQASTGAVIDSFTISDSATRTGAHPRAPTDSFAISDSVHTQVGVSASDSLTISDVATD